MPVNPDFSDLFKTFNEEGVEFIVVGAHAVMFYTEPRYTKDLDVWVSSSMENACRVYKALAVFGAPLSGLSASDFTDDGMVYQIGVEPNRIDILMGISCVGFEEAKRHAIETTYGGERIFILGKSDLLRSKRSLNRKQDQIDIEKLEEDEVK